MYTSSIYYDLDNEIYESMHLTRKQEDDKLIQESILREDNIKKSEMKENLEYLQQEDFVYTTELDLKFSDLEKDGTLSKSVAKQLFSQFKETDLNQHAKTNKTGFNAGPLSSIPNMVETTYVCNQKQKYRMAEDVCYLELLTSKWRVIGGDGNCYYRSVIFGFLENIVFEKDINMIKNIIVSLYEKFDPGYVNTKKLPYIIKESITKLDRSLIVNILYIIYHWMNNSDSIAFSNNKAMDSYILLLKAFNFCKIFDLGMVVYFRYILYEFILNNQEKLYSEEFPVNLGNLLPNQYETSEGKFLFEKFFEEDLLKLYSYAERISIYITPFVLKSDIKVIVYDFGVDCNIQTKDFKCLLEKKHEISKELL